MQTLLGYTAEQAGLALLPGGFSLMLLMPLVGFLLSRYDARKLMVYGLVVLSFSLFHMTNFTLGVDFRTVVYARMIQTMGLAFLFIPINTAPLRVPAQGQEQCSLWADEPGAKRGRQRGYFDCDHNARPPVAISHRAHVEPSFARQPAGPVHASGHGAWARGPGVFSLGSHAQGLRAVAGECLSASGDAGLH